MKGNRIGIIGAGPSGLAAIKACLEEGFKPVAFERTDQLGKSNRLFLGNFSIEKKLRL